MGEIIRAGLLSVDPNQKETAQAFGTVSYTHLEQGITAFRAGHEGESQTDRNRDHQNRCV